MRVAVIGAGHGGLSAAGHRAIKGHAVRLFSFSTRGNWTRCSSGAAPGEDENGGRRDNSPEGSLWTTAGVLSAGIVYVGIPVFVRPRS